VTIRELKVADDMLLYWLLRDKDDSSIPLSKLYQWLQPYRAEMYNVSWSLLLRVCHKLQVLDPNKKPISLLDSWAPVVFYARRSERLRRYRRVVNDLAWLENDLSDSNYRGINKDVALKSIRNVKIITDIRIRDVDKTFEDAYDL
jgi:hypothetical protein